MDPFEELLEDRLCATNAVDIDRTKTKINISEFMPKVEDMPSFNKKKSSKKKPAEDADAESEKNKGTTSLADIMARRKAKAVTEDDKKERAHKKEAESLENEIKMLTEQK